jgi:acyl-CoA thioesterase-1
MLFRLLLIFILNGAVSPLLAAPAHPDSRTISSFRVPTILVYGDSLSAAYGIAREQGWVSLLQQRLQSQDYPYQVVNASVSGETTLGGLTRMPATLRQQQPAIVLIELGANDGLRGLPVAEMQRNLSAMIEASQKIKAKVMLIGVEIPPNYGPRYTREFSETYPGLAKRYKLPLLPFLLDGVAGKSELTQDDGLHPVAAAQERLLDNVWNVLEPMLGKSRH